MCVTSIISMHAFSILASSIFLPTRPILIHFRSMDGSIARNLSALCTITTGGQTQSPVRPPIESPCTHDDPKPLVLTDNPLCCDELPYKLLREHFPGWLRCGPDLLWGLKVPRASP